LAAVTFATSILGPVSGVAPLVPNGKLVAARGMINGSGPYDVVLDTGASYSIIDTPLAKRLHLAIGERITGVGAGGTFTTHELRPLRIAIGGAAFTTSGARTAMLNDPSHPHIDAIVGYDFFSAFAVTVDRTSHRVTMASHAGWVPPVCDWVPLTFHRHWPYVPARITVAGKTVTRSVLFDIGSEDDIDSDVVVAAPDKKIIAAGVGLGGRQFRAYVGTVDAVEIGRARVTHVRGVYSSDLQAIWLLGGGISGRFNYTVDYAGRRLCLVSR
jgi:Aspartyl protease